MKKIASCLAAIFITACVHAQHQPEQENAAAQFPPKAVRDANTKLTWKIIDAPNHTYGRLSIHQKSMLGNEGFKTKTDASKVAQLAIGKIKHF